MSRAARWQPGRGLRIVMLGFLVMTACLLVTTLALGQWRTALVSAVPMLPVAAGCVYYLRSPA